jgi:hypothetical protein
MTLTSKITNTLSLVLLVTAVMLPGKTAAQDSLTISVSPTLFEMTANPGQEWTSTVRVINGNPYNLSIYVDVVNFAAQGERGQARFLPVFTEETGGQTLAEWFVIERKELTIPAEQTVEVPFTIVVPEDAPPGGHYSAILIGTQSLETAAGQTQVETSQVVTSLVFLRVTGDVIEEGSIRSFRSSTYITEQPQVDFELRFQNSGNVHILPQGEIKILNMWGRERGIIPVNRQTMFGNVLPGSVRNYSFTWTGEWSLADIGRYKAIATLAYGEDGRKFTSAETTFWVIPWKIAGTILIAFVLFIWILTWSIKLYVRKMLMMAGVRADGAVTTVSTERRPSSRKKVAVAVAPLEEGILDLRQRFRESGTWTERGHTVIAFAMHYKIFFAVALLVLLAVILLTWYVRAALINERPYEVIIQGIESDVTISSDQLEYEARKEEMPADDVLEVSVREDFPAIKMVNQSGVSGLGAALRLMLEAEGYPILELRNDLEQTERNTVIVYAPEYAEEALQLSGELFGALLSAYPEASGADTPIIIYVGKDLENAVQ